MKTVIITGFAGNTLQYLGEVLEEYPDAELWSMNWAHEYEEIPLDRLTALFEIHLPEYIRSMDGPKGMRHQEFLRRAQPFPIFGFPDSNEWPSMIEYPWENVKGLMGNLYSGTTPIYPMGSSMDYAIGKAVLDGRFERIVIIGAEMAEGTEYQHQKPTISYWMGQCDARGIEVVIHEKSRLLRPKPYHMGSQTIAKPLVKKYQDLYKDAHDTFKTKLVEASDTYAQKQQEFGEDLAKLRPYGEALNFASTRVSLSSGALQLTKTFHENMDTLIGRQTLESQYREQYLDRQHALSLYNEILGEFNNAKAEGASPEIIEQLSQRLGNQQATVYAKTGALSALKQFMREIDEEDVPFELIDDLSYLSMEVPNG